MQHLTKVFRPLPPSGKQDWANFDPNSEDESRTLNGLPPRAVIDSNVLLDAALIADGFGASALRALNLKRIPLYVDDASYRDATRILKRYQSNTAVDLEFLLNSACDHFLIIHVPPGDKAQNHRVKRQDSHLVRAAKTFDAFVVTDDAPLLHQLYQSAVHGVSTRELALLPYHRRLPPSHYHIGGKMMGYDAAYIFIRCLAHASTLDGTRPESTLWESVPLGRFFFDLQRKGFVFAAPWASEDVFLEFEPPLKHPIVILLNLDFPPRGGTNLSVRAALGHPLVPGQEDISRSCSRYVVTRPPVAYGAKFQIGNSYRLGNGWAGVIAHMVWGSGKIRPDAWKCYRYVPYSAPNPFSANVLGVAITRLEVFEDLVRLPQLGEVLAANVLAPELGMRPI